MKCVFAGYRAPTVVLLDLNAIYIKAILLYSVYSESVLGLKQLSRMVRERLRLAIKYTLF